MGFYFQSERRGLTEGLSPTITAREYVSALSIAIRTLPASPERRCHRYQLGLRYLTVGLSKHAANVFSGLIQQEPNDPPAHRLLAMALLSQEDLTAAVKHLEIALGLLRREAVIEVGLCHTLRIQCEAARLRLLLLPLYMRVGRLDAVRNLLREGQVL